MANSFTEAGCGKNNLDTGEYRMNQGIRRSQKIRTQIEAVWLKKSLSQNDELNQPASIQKELVRVSLFSSQPL